MIRQGRGKEPAGLRLFPKGDKYGHSDSIIRSSRIVCGAYSIRPYKRGCVPRPHLLCLSSVGVICGAYAIRPYRQGWRLVFLSPFLSLMKEKEAKENQGVRDASQIYRVPAGDVRDTDPIRHIRPIFPGLGRGLDLLLPSFPLSREEKKVLADLCLSPVGAIWGAYAIRPYVGGFAPRFHPPRLSPIGAICGAYAFAPLRRGLRPHTPGRGCVCAPPLNGLMRSVIQVCGAAEGARGVGEGRYGTRVGLKWSTYYLLI